MTTSKEKHVQNVLKTRNFPPDRQQIVKIHLKIKKNIFKKEIHSQLNSALCLRFLRYPVDLFFQHTGKTSCWVGCSVNVVRVGLMLYTKLHYTTHRMIFKENCKWQSVEVLNCRWYKLILFRFFVDCSDAWWFVISMTSEIQYENDGVRCCGL